MNKHLSVFILAFFILFTTVSSVCMASDNETLQYNGDTVQSIYSLDYKNRSYQEVKNRTDQIQLLSLIEKTDAPSAKDIKFGYLIVTDKSKHAIYLPEQSEDKATQKLINLSKQCNATNDRHPQWLIYMSESNIDSIHFNGQDKRTGDLLSATVTNEKSISKISDFLKSITVQLSPEISPITTPNPSLPDEGNIDYHLTIQFKNGIKYDCYGEPLTIVSSDQKDKITYKLNFTSIQELWNTFASLDSSEKVSTVALMIGLADPTGSLEQDEGMLSDDIAFLRRIDRLLQQMTPCGPVAYPLRPICIYLNGTEYNVYREQAIAVFNGTVQYYKVEPQLYQTLEEIIETEGDKHQSNAFIIQKTVKDDSSQNTTKFLYDRQIQEELQELFATIKSGQPSPTSFSLPVKSYIHVYSSVNEFLDCVLIEYEEGQPRFDYSGFWRNFTKDGNSYAKILYTIDDTLYEKAQALLSEY